MKRSNNRISIRSKKIQSKSDNDIQSKLGDNLYSSFAELNIAEKAI